MDDCAFAAELFKKAGFSRTGHLLRCAGCAVAELERFKTAMHPGIISIIEKQRTILSLALAHGIGGPDTRVDETVAENAQFTITNLESLTKLKELPMHPDPEINKEVNADIREGAEADRKAGLPPEDFSEMFVSSFDPNWLPTSENVNKLPMPLRQYIHDIETKCDPAGDASKIILQNDAINAQAIRIKELENACDIFEKNSNEAARVFEVLHRSGLVPAEKPGPTLAGIVENLISKVAGLEETIGRLMATKSLSPPGSGHVIGAAILLRDLPPEKQVALQCIVRNMQRLEEDLDIEKAKHDMLFQAIETHQKQKGDDRCWIDDGELYAVAGLKDANTALPSKEEFLSNCARFHASRQNPGDKYVTVEKRIRDAVETARGEWHTQFGEELRVEKEATKQKDSELKKASRKIKSTTKDLVAAIERQRKIGGREAGSLMAKYIIPAAKRLGWKPLKEKARGTRKG